MKISKSKDKKLCISKCLCGGFYYMTKLKGNRFEAQCSKCLEAGITNVIKGTVEKKLDKQKRGN